MNKCRLALWLLLLLCILLVPMQVFALADPDTILIQSINRYDDVSVTDDALFVIEYQVLYTVLPAENIAQGYFAILSDGNGQLASANPYAGGVIPDLGYSNGIFSFYLPDDTIISGTLTVALVGNPSISPSPAGINSTTITTRTPTGNQTIQDLLAIDTRILTERLENQWDVDLMDYTGGPGRFTDSGEEYFSNAVPDLRLYAPALFQFSSVGFNDDKETFDNSVANDAENFFQGTSIDNSIGGSAEFLDMNRTMMEIIIVLLIAGAVGFFMLRLTGHTGVALLGAVVIINFGTAMSMGPLAFAGVLAFTGILTIGYWIFFARVGGSV